MVMHAEQPPWCQELGHVIKSKQRSGAVRPEEKPARQIGDVAHDSTKWNAFEFADKMEQGLAPGLTASFVEPLQGERENSEQRLRVRRSDNQREYLLMDKGEKPLLLAVTDAAGLRFDIYIARPGQPPSALGPAFQLESNGSAKSSWTLQSLRCEGCEARHRPSSGIRQLGHVRQYTEPLGEGQALCMDVDLPAPLSSSGSVVWCPACSHQQGNQESVTVTSRRPKWNERYKTLTLNFYGRCTVASSKNFQLVMPEEDHASIDSMKLLFGKIGTHLFVLDYKRPFGMVQAFGVALTSCHWK